MLSHASSIRLSEDLLHHAPMHVSEPELTPLKWEGEPFMIDAEQMEDCGLEVMDVDASLGHIEAVVVGGAVRKAALDAAPGHP